MINIRTNELANLFLISNLYLTLFNTIKSKQQDFSWGIWGRLYVAGFDCDCNLH